MRKLLCSLVVMAAPLSAAAEGAIQLTLTTWHLRPAADVVTTHGARCGDASYTFTVTTSPPANRATAVTLATQLGAVSRTVDLTPTALGQLMTEPTGFGELSFACRPQSLFVFYKGATRASETAGLAQQSAVFALSPEGKVSVPPPEGITTRPLPNEN